MLVFNERTGEFEERLGLGEKPTIGGSTNSPANLSNSSNSSFDNRPTREYVRSKVIEILSDVLFVEPDEIEDWNDLQDDLFADSVDAQEIIERVEDEFGITVLDEEAEEIIDVDGMIDFICDELNIDYDDEYFEFDNTWTSDDEDEEDDDFDEDDDWDEDDEDFDEDLDDDDDDDWYDKLDEEGKRNVLLEVVKSMARDFRSGYNPKFAPMSEHLYRRDIIQDTVFGIIADKFGIDYDVINEDSCFVTDLGADSLDIVDLIMALEKEFGLSIPDNDVEELITVGDAVDYIYYNAN